MVLYQRPANVAVHIASVMDGLFLGIAIAIAWGTKCDRVYSAMDGPVIAVGRAFGNSGNGKWKTEMVKMKIVYFLIHASLKRPPVKQDH